MRVPKRGLHGLGFEWSDLIAPIVKAGTTVYGAREQTKLQVELAKAQADAIARQQQMQRDALLRQQQAALTGQQVVVGPDGRPIAIPVQQQTSPYPAWVLPVGIISAVALALFGLRR